MKKIASFLKKPDFSRYIVAIIFIAAAILHFVYTEAYIRVMPEYIPYHRAMVLISGMAELTGGVGILIPKVRIWAGWELIILLIAVFPANIEIAIDVYHRFGWSFNFIANLLRLPLQFVLIYWIYWCCIKPQRAQ